MRWRRALSSWWFAGLVSLAVGIALLPLLHWLMPFDGLSDEGADYLLFFAHLFFLIAAGVCLLITIVPWHAVDLGGRLDRSALTKAGYEVVERGGSIDVRVARWSVARIREGRTAFRALPHRTALLVMVLLPAVPGLGVGLFLFSLYIYAQCWEGVEALSSKMRGVGPAEDRGVEELMVDSLSSAYILARDALDVEKGSFQDRGLVLVSLALVAWVVLLALTGPTSGHGHALLLGIGTLIIAGATAGGVLLLRRRCQEDIAREEAWAERILAAMRDREGVSSSVGLLLDICLEVPRWLEVRRRGVWNRAPGKTLLIVLLFISGGQIMALYGPGWWGAYIIGAGLIALGTGLFLDESVRARKEHRRSTEDWDRKLAELYLLLEPGGGR